MSIQAISCAMALRGVSPSEKLLLLALANYADEHMSCYPSQRRLADDTCLSDRTIRTLLAALEERGMLSRQGRVRPDGSRASDVVTLHFSGPAVAQISGGAEMVSGGVRKQLPGGAEMVSGLTTFEPSPEPSIEPAADDAREVAVDWSLRLKEAWDAAGDGIDQTSPSIHAYSDLRILVEPSVGEPCEWSEVLDAIRVRAKGRTKIRSWSWVREQAEAFRDRRLAGLNAPHATGPPASITDRMAAEQAEARRKAFELLDARAAKNG